MKAFRNVQFLSAWLRDPMQTGALLPSGTALAEAIAAQIDPLAVEDELFAILVDRRSTHPCVIAIMSKARSELFLPQAQAMRARAAPRQHAP